MAPGGFRKSIRGRATLGLALALAGCGRWADDLFCDSPGCDWSNEEWARLVPLANPPPPPSDPTNHWADDTAAATLGQRFYFDAAFSGPSRMMDALRRPTLVGRSAAGQPSLVSCATCHALTSGGVDISSIPGNVSIGAGTTDVNAISTINAGRQGSVFWNGRLDSLWGLNLVVAESDTTMNGNRLQTAHVLADSYGDDVQAVFGTVLVADWRERVRLLPATGKPGSVSGCQPDAAGEPARDAYDCLPASDQALATTLLVVWAKAIAAYERRLVSKDSAFDRFIAEGPRSSAISALAQRGARLFVGKASCVSCHAGPLLSDGAFHNVGAPQRGPGVPTIAACTDGSPCDCVAGKNCLPWGAYNGLIWRRDTGPRWFSILDAWNDAPDARPTPAPREPFDESLKGAWRTPSLRDVALTAPYMHDGSLATLGDVLRHYNDGDASDAVGQPSAEFRPLGLDADDLAALSAFLETLTGAPQPSTLASPQTRPTAPDGGTSDAGAPDAPRADAAPRDAPSAETTPADAGARVPSQVQAVFDAAACSFCHFAGAPTGLVLDDAAASYTTLVGVHAVGTGCTARVRVVRGDPAASYLIAKVRGTAPLCGSRMPYNRPPLSEAQLTTLEAWIATLDDGRP